MYFITTKRMLEVCFSAHPNIQYRTVFLYSAFPRSRPAARILLLAGWPTCGWPVGRIYTCPDNTFAL